MKKRTKKLRARNKTLPKRRRRPDSLIIRTLREQNRFLTREYQFLKGKCERLELSLLESRPGASSNYVARTDEAKRPPITEVTAPAKLTFKDLRSEWDKMSAEEQEQHIQNRDWQVDKSKGTN